MQPMQVRGVTIHQGYLSRAAQEVLVSAVRAVVAEAPMVHPQTPGGQQMSVRMTSAGRCGWVTDRTGYRYQAHHPNGTPWPAIPRPALEIWQALVGEEREPDCCLINYYGEGARMGMHQDRDEGDFGWPVLSVSLGDEGLFRIGGRARRGPTQSLWLRSGDVVMMGDEARLCYHGVDRIRYGSSTLLPRGGRLNLTLRVVEPSLIRGLSCRPPRAGTGPE